MALLLGAAITHPGRPRSPGVDEVKTKESGYRKFLQERPLQHGDLYP